MTDSISFVVPITYARVKNVKNSIRRRIMQLNVSDMVQVIVRSRKVILVRVS